MRFIKVLVLSWAILGSIAGGLRAELRGAKPQLIKVTEQVYSAVGYALGNVLFVITDSSVVVIDTTESPAAAREALAALRRVSDLPIRYIIYTHFHGDHINGAVVFRQRDAGPVDVIAQQMHDQELIRYQLLRDYNKRLNAIQFGSALPRRDITMELAVDPLRPAIGYVRPTITFDQQYSFEEGGVKFELHHTSGETLDHLMVWLPEQQVLFPGDLFYDSFPMLSSPMKHDRPVTEWAESIERMQKLGAQHLVPSHTLPVSGGPIIDEMLTSYAAAIRWVHDETVRCINEGLSLTEARRSVRLPGHLAQKPYLAERYGRVDWSVCGIYRQYTGWYDQIPAHLNPSPSAELHRALVEAAGGVEPIVEQARLAHQGGKQQLALELLTVVLDADSNHAAAHRLAAEVLGKLAAASRNGVERNVYLVAEQEHRQAAEGSSR